MCSLPVVLEVPLENGDPQEIFENKPKLTLPEIPLKLKPVLIKSSSFDKSPDTPSNSKKIQWGVLPPRKPKTKWKTYGGIILSLSSSLFVSVAFLVIKSLENHGVKAFGAALLFNTGVLVPCIVAMLINEYGPGWEKRSRLRQGLKALRFRIVFILMIQGILQGSLVVFQTFSLQYISVGDMTVIVFSSPILTTILAHFIVGEKVGTIFIITAIYTLLGVGLITKPPVLTGAKQFDQHTVIGSAFAVGALCALSLKFVVTRKIKRLHFLTMTCSLGAFGVLISLPLFLIFEEPGSLIHSSSSGLLLRLGLVTGFCAVASVNLALKMETAGVVALVRSCDVIFAFLLQFIFLGVVPDLFSAIGGFIVWSGVIIVGGQKWWTERKAKKIRDEIVGNGEMKSKENGHNHDITKYPPGPT